MKKKSVGLVLALVLLMNVATSFAFEKGLTLTAYDFIPSVSTSGTAWFQNGFIKLQNTSGQVIRNWTFEFETDTRIQKMENVIYKEVLLENGTYKYIVKPASWMTWVENQTWTHKYAVLPNQTISLKIYGDNKSNISGLQLKNCILYDAFKAPIKVEEWKVKGIYNTGDVVFYKDQVYKCRQGHTVHAPNWTPVSAPALWSKTAIKTINTY